MAKQSIPADHVLVTYPDFDEPVLVTETFYAEHGESLEMKIVQKSTETLDATGEPVSATLGDV